MLIDNSNSYFFYKILFIRMNSARPSVLSQLPITLWFLGVIALIG